MSRRFDVLATGIDGLVVLRRQRIGDERGFFERLFCDDELAPVLGARRIRQINHSVTRTKGTVRGLHFQHAPHAETKFVTCVRGRVFDVAVDLRRGSPTYLAWEARILDADAAETFVIPEGFAHGFQTLAADSELLYLHTAAHAPGAEGGLHPMDPTLAITWPEPVVRMSARDDALPRLADGFAGLAP